MNFWWLIGYAFMFFSIGYRQSCSSLWPLPDLLVTKEERWRRGPDVTSITDKLLSLTTSTCRRGIINAAGTTFPTRKYLLQTRPRDRKCTHTQMRARDDGSFFFISLLFWKLMVDRHPFGVWKVNACFTACPPRVSMCQVPKCCLTFGMSYEIDGAV